MEAQVPTRPTQAKLAGNIQPGQDDTHPSPTKLRSSYSLLTTEEQPVNIDAVEIAEPLANAQLIATASAKLSYLIDEIIKHQDQEQIIVFYENENVATTSPEIFEIVGW